MPRASAAYVAQVKYWRRHYPLAVLDQVPPVQNTWYTLLETVEDVWLAFVRVLQANDEVAVKNINMRWTADGRTLTRQAGDLGQANNTTNWWSLQSNTLDDISGSTTITPAGTAIDGGGPFFGLSVKLEVRLTSVVGTNQTLRARAIYYLEEAT